MPTPTRGTTTINSGTITPSNATALGNNSAVTVGATLNITTDVSAGSLAGTGAVTLSGNTLTTGGVGASTRFSGIVSGTGGVTKAGTNAFTLSGTNTYTGTSAVSAGTLDVTGPIALSVVVVDGGGTLQIDGASLSDSGSVTLNDNGILNLTGNEQVGALASASGASTVTLVANTLTVNTVGAGSFAGVISGTGGFIKTGTGTQNITGNNTYSGETTITAGTLALGSRTAARTGAITTTGSVIDYANGINVANTVVVNSDTTQLQVNGADTATQSGIISVLGGARPLEKIGTGTLTLSAANTYSGDTTISAGTLQANFAGSLGSTTQGDVIVDAGFLNLNGATHTKQTLRVTAGNVTNGTMNVEGFFGDTVSITATVNATGYTHNEW